ncbi:MAG: thermonuclease family protein [Pseudomonadota bacterium]
MLSSSQTAFAENIFPIETKELKHTFSGRIDKIIDGQTILLTNDKIIRLVGLDTPSDKTNLDNNYALKAKMKLTELLPEGTEIMIYQTRVAKKGRVNRMGHDLGHILTKEKPETPSLWLQQALLEQGLARVSLSESNPELAQFMLKAEKKARNEKKGLWAEESPFQVITPETAQKGMGQFSVVEGTITKAATVRNNLYLNFGADWKTDFTIMISSTLRKKLARQAVDLMNLSGKKVRVRGWIREYNGPLIELDMVEHLELLEEATIDVPDITDKVE